MTNDKDGALVGTDPDQGQVVKIKVSRIRRWEDQPRKHFDKEGLERLGKSLKTKQRTPIKVKRITGDPNHDYEIIDGERRWRAAQLVGIEYLLGWVKSVEDEDEQYIDSFITNVCRADHTPIEKAEGLQRLHESGMTKEKMADETGYSIAWVEQHLSLLRLVPEVQALMDPERPKEKRLTFSIALTLVPLSPELQRDLAEEIVDKKIPLNDARFLVKSQAIEVGKGLNSKANPLQDYKILSRFVSRTQTQSRALVEMTNGKLAEMVGSRPPEEVEILSGKITDSLKNLEQLVEKMKIVKGLVEQSRR